MIFKNESLNGISFLLPNWLDNKLIASLASFISALLLLFLFDLFLFLFLIKFSKIKFDSLLDVTLL